MVYVCTVFFCFCLPSSFWGGKVGFRGVGGIAQDLDILVLLLPASWLESWDALTFRVFFLGFLGFRV